MRFKRLFVLFSAVISPMTVCADHSPAVKIDGLYYELSSNTASLCYYWEEISIEGGVYREKYYNSCNGDLVIPSRVTYNGKEYTVVSISDEAFAGDVTSLTIPESISYISKTAFMGCRIKTSIIVNKGNAVYDSRDNCNAIIKTSENELIKGCKNTKIPESVISIGDFAFYGCRGLTSISIPDGVVSIGHSVFKGCRGLTSINIPDNVPEICRSTFEDCESLSSATIGNKVTSIGDRAFFGCANLSSIVIPNSVTSIGGNAFSCCSALNSVSIGSNVASIGWCAFLECTNLSSLSIHSSVTFKENTFKGCNLEKIHIDTEEITDQYKSSFGGFAITEIEIGNNAKTIEEDAFSGLKDIKTITIGSSVETIKTRAFSGMDNLEVVKCKATKVPDTHRTTFENSYTDYVLLYVPEESIEEYKATAPWSGFKSILGTSTTVYTITYIVDGEVYKTQTYEEGDNISPEPTPTKEGYIFSGWDNLPDVMPGEDVTVTGTFTEIPPEKCSAPTINIVKGEIVFTCETDGASFHYDVKSLDDKNGEGNNIKLTNTYQVSVYASKEGFSDSDVTTKEIKMSLYDANGDGVLDAADIVFITNLIMNGRQ